MPLTDSKIRAIERTHKVQRFTHKDGLALHVTRTGKKLFKKRCRWQGKQLTLPVGEYPQMTLAVAVQESNRISVLIGDGIDPRVSPESDSDSSFETTARELLNTLRGGKMGESTYQRALSRLERFVFPHIGTWDVGEVTTPELLKVLRKVEATGAVETCHRVKSLCKRVFRYGVTTGRCKSNPATEIDEDALATPISKGMATIIEPSAVGELMRAIDGYVGRDASVNCALRLAPLLFLRPGELRQMDWESVDFDRQEIRLSAEKMKMDSPHIVPLSRQALALLSEHHKRTGSSKHCFPSPVDKERCISDNTLRAALRRMGYANEDMSVHGFRAMASTLLYERQYNGDWIEAQLAHNQGRHTIRKKYDYSRHLAKHQRPKMMQEWADYLDELKGSVTRRKA